VHKKINFQFAYGSILKNSLKGNLMKKKLLLASLVVAGTLFYGGCSATQQPLYNVQNSSVQTFDGRKLTAAQVEKAILQAGVQRGWRMQKVKDGLITGTLVVRTHSAVIEVKYNSSSYSITYKNSTDLNYDGVNIHKNYNSWVRNLDNSIQLYLNNN
jgi:PBP1b-binding outer membrane lipoprotein LpoB